MILGALIVIGVVALAYQFGWNRGYMKCINEFSEQSKKIEQDFQEFTLDVMKALRKNGIELSQGG